VELRASEILVLLNSSEIVTTWEKNISTILNEKLQIRDNDSVNTHILRSAHEYAFTGQIVGYLVTIKMGYLNTVCFNRLIAGGQA
jgi:RAB protein geranylgeranyltransferase component A